MTDYRYFLDKSSRKHLCPECGKRRFVRYVDSVTSEYLPGIYGRCDREANCSYHLNPYKDGYHKRQWQDETGNTWRPKRRKAPRPRPQKKKQVPFDWCVLKTTAGGYLQNTFIQNLLHNVPYPLRVDDVNRVTKQYLLGTIKTGYRKGAITFPFVDQRMNARAVQVKEFDRQNNTTATDFLHSMITRDHERNKQPLPRWLQEYNANEKKVTCLFGAHLLPMYPLNPVALVEAPKTAIYGTLYFGEPIDRDNYLWLAVYNLSSLNFDKCKVLKGRDVVLFPDLSKDGKSFRLWSEKAKELQRRMPDTHFKVSDLLERMATDKARENGLDLADFIISMDWRRFRGREESEKSEDVKTKVFPQGVNYQHSEN